MRITIPKIYYIYSFLLKEQNMRRSQYIFITCFLSVSLVLAGNTVLSQNTPFYTGTAVVHKKEGKQENSIKPDKALLQPATGKVLLKKITGPDGIIMNYTYNNKGMLLRAESRRSSGYNLATDSTCDHFYYDHRKRVYMVMREEWLLRGAPGEENRNTYKKIYYRDTTSIIVKMESSDFRHDNISISKYRYNNNTIILERSFATVNPVDTFVMTNDNRNILRTNRPFYDAENTSFINVRSPGSYLPSMYNSIYSNNGALYRDGSFHLQKETKIKDQGNVYTIHVVGYTTNEKGLVTQVVQENSNYTGRQFIYNFEYETRNLLK